MPKNTKIAPPPKKNIGKGKPPPVSNPSENLGKKMDEESIALNFRVSAEFRKRLRQYALDNDTSAVQVMMKAVEQYIGSQKL
ncbi:MAG: hypothetical protein HRU28_02110 [Rhizobiales bacterium]|nr:hypothetical protein [Hyphomicrobiales bacterium]